MYSVRLRPEDVQGVPHVSLEELIDQCGGYCRVEPARVNADLAGRSIVVGVNDTKVYTSHDQFSLAHPVIRHRGQVLIAVEDVATLITQGFAAAIKQPDEIPESHGGEDEAVPPPSPPAEADTGGAPLNRRTEDTGLPAPRPLNAPTETAEPAPRFQTVIIDPGHGGTDPGYVCADGFAEKDLTLAVALALREILKETTSLRTFCTRSKDTSVRLQDRVAFAQQNQGDLLISIHGAAATSATAEGFGIYYASPTQTAASFARIRLRRPGIPLVNAPGDYRTLSLQAARAIETALGAAEGGGGKHWVREAPIRILRDAGMPGVLIEVGHLSNPAEATLLEARSQQRKIAQGIAEGIAALLNTSGGPEALP